jgi:hypothetical protein
VKALSETVAALGRPVLFRSIGSIDGPQALIARWKHGDARVETNAADALRVCLSLCGGHTARHGRWFQHAREIISGSVSVFAADRYSEVGLRAKRMWCRSSLIPPT